jgi:hypothetical protein
MVYCATFGCNNQAKKGNGLSFSFIPERQKSLKSVDTLLQEMGLRSPSQSQVVFCAFLQGQLRMAELDVHGKFQARLKPDTVPSIPLTVSREVKDGRPIQLAMPRAFEKRRKAQVSKVMQI